MTSTLPINEQYGAAFNPFADPTAVAPASAPMGARKALEGFWSQEVTGQDLLFGITDTNVAAQVGGGGFGSGKLLEFPENVGTEDMKHFVVFNIYNGIESAMSPEELALYESGETNELFGGIAVSATTFGVTSLLTAKGITKLSTMSTKLAKLPKVGPFIALAAGAYAAFKVWGVGEQAGAYVLNTEQETAAQAQWNEIKTGIRAAAMAEADIEFGNPEQTGRLTRIGKAHVKSMDTIALYMPQKINAMSILEYEQQDMRFIQNIINDWTGAVANIGLSTAPKVADEIASLMGTNSNIDVAIKGAMRMAPNPRKQLMFREPVSRKFEFNFNLSPRNPTESARAYEIIQMFKKHAYPQLAQTAGSGAFYRFPAEFEIKYYTMQNGEPVENDFLNKIQRCALREINVDYASSGSFSTFENGAPTNMIMSLTFEEMELLDSGLIEKGY
jgi:hypothetical protein